MKNDFLLKDQNVTHNGKVYNIQYLVDYIENNNIPIQKILIKNLYIFLLEDCWNNGNGKFSPIDVLTNRFKNKEYTDEFNRAMNSNLEYPIIYSKEYESVSDGIHRLLKAYMLGHETIDAYILDKMPE